MGSSGENTVKTGAACLSERLLFAYVESYLWFMGIIFTVKERNIHSILNSHCGKTR